MGLVIIFAVVIILTFITVHIQLEKIEKKNFNNGICPKCGHPLVPFDTPTSSDGRGYECLNCNYTTWVEFYSTVDRDFRKHYPR